MWKASVHSGTKNLGSHFPPPPPPAPEGCGAAEILALIVLAVVDCIKVGNCKAREVAYTLLSSLVWIPSLAF